MMHIGRRKQSKPPLDMKIEFQRKYGASRRLSEHVGEVLMYRRESSVAACLAYPMLWGAQLMPQHTTKLELMCGNEIQLIVLYASRRISLCHR